MTPPQRARRALDQWRASQPSDRYLADAHVIALNDRYLTTDRAKSVGLASSEFAIAVGSRLPRLIEHYEAHDRLPRLSTHDGHGNRVDEIVFDGAYHEAGRVVWSSGLVAAAAAPGNSFEMANLAYQLSHEGEMGHMCPVVCTIGLIRALVRAAADDVRDRFVPKFTKLAYDDAWRGAQFLTEVQGGSDVGSNDALARRESDGSWRISGEKWFCSVADADAFLVTARPEDGQPGTTGLGCFIVPRRVDGRPNGFAIRRLKDKLGTRAMASAEIDFTDALAYPVGPVAEGFRTMVSAMLNSSRWLNAVGNAGILHRAFLEASSYAVHRTAFDTPIAEFPAVRLALAGIKTDWLATLHSTWRLTALDEAVDCGDGFEADDIMVHRFLVNGNKLTASLDATSGIRDAIEILGGNGAIESFSPLPRLLRDAVVFEQWEGTHNVLAAQVLRDMSKLGMAAAVVDDIARQLKGVAAPDLAPTVATASALLETVATVVARCVDDFEYGAWHFRRQLIRLVRLVQVASLLHSADLGEGRVRSESHAAADLVIRRHLDDTYVPEQDVALSSLVDAVLGPDVAPPARGMG